MYYITSRAKNEHCFAEMQSSASRRSIAILIDSDIGGARQGSPFQLWQRPLSVFMGE